MPFTATIPPSARIRWAAAIASSAPVVVTPSRVNLSVGPQS